MQNDGGIQFYQTVQAQEEQKGQIVGIEYQCPYCGKSTTELATCCSERHGEQIFVIGE